MGGNRGRQGGGPPSSFQQGEQARGVRLTPKGVRRLGGGTLNAILSWGTLEVPFIIGVSKMANRESHSHQNRDALAWLDPSVTRKTPRAQYYPRDHVAHGSVAKNVRDSAESPSSDSQCSSDPKCDSDEEAEIADLHSRFLCRKEVPSGT